jgi:hypothetical protein
MTILEVNQRPEVRKTSKFGGTLRDQKVHELSLRLPILGMRVRLGSFFGWEIGHFPPKPISLYSATFGLAGVGSIV